MNLEEQGILAQTKKPGALTRAAMEVGIMSGMPASDPDVDQRRSYSPGYGQAFAYRGGSSSPSGPGNGPDSTALTPVAQGIAAPINEQAANRPGPNNQGTHPGSAISAALGAAPQGTPAVGKPEIRQDSGQHAASPNQPMGIADGIGPISRPGRNASGTITAESAQAAMGNDMQRSGGIAGSIDMAGVNAIMARENQARGEMIDSSIKANGGNGIAALPDYTPPAGQGIGMGIGMGIGDIQSAMKSAGTRTERAAYGRALSQAIAGQNQQAVEGMRLQGDMNQRGIMAGIELDKQAGIDQRAADRNQTQVRGQDLTASTAADRMASQERIAEKRTDNAGGRLNLAQSRSNFEIDAAREKVAGLSPEEIKRKTSSFTATGRENPDFDPTLAKSVALANRRKYGADDHFDQREQAQQPAGTDGDAMTRFRADQAMQGRKLGNQTDRGHEVLDGAGKVIGYWN